MWNKLVEAFYEELDGRVGNRLYTDGYSDETVRLSLEEIEKNGDYNVLVYTNYWLKYLELKVKKGDAVAGWSRKSTSSGINVTFDIHFIDKGYNRCVVTVDVICNGSVGKASFQIDDEGVQYISEDVFESIDSAWNRDTNPFVSSETHLTHSSLRSAVESAMETIMKCLSIAADQFGYGGEEAYE